MAEYGTCCSLPFPHSLRLRRLCRLLPLPLLLLLLLPLMPLLLLLLLLLSHLLSTGPVAADCFPAHTQEV